MKNKGLSKKDLELLKKLNVECDKILRKENEERIKKKMWEQRNEINPF
jgi:hypothetical protein